MAELWFEPWHLPNDPTFSTTPWFWLANCSYVPQILHQPTNIYWVLTMWQTLFHVNEVIATILKKDNAKLSKSLQSVATDSQQIFFNCLSNARYYPRQFTECQSLQHLVHASWVSARVIIWESAHQKSLSDASQPVPYRLKFLLLTIWSGSVFTKQQTVFNNTEFT